MASEPVGGRSRATELLCFIFNYLFQVSFLQFYCCIGLLNLCSRLLFFSGWVVGSLEILGSPTGLIRSLGNGVSDLFRMPYEGFTQGPGAFIGGVTRGMGSLLRHVSTGLCFKLFSSMFVEGHSDERAPSD